MDELKTVIFFGGSEKLKDQVKEDKLKGELEVFLNNNRDKIEEILFGGSDLGVMGIVHSVALEYNIKITGISLDEFKRYDKNNSVEDIEFLANDLVRIEKFIQEGNVFIALPGGLGTITEIGNVLNSGNYVYVSSLFNEFITLLNELNIQNDKLLETDISKIEI